MSHTLRPLWTLACRELIRFYRQRSRIVGTLGTPLVFWIFLGTGLGAAFGTPGKSGRTFVEYLFPGNVLLSVLFTAIFSTITIIEDRREGFLQAVLVAPVSALGLTGGKVLGGALIALLQGSVFLLLAPVAGLTLTVTGVAMALSSLFVTAVSLTALGFFFAWWFDSVQGFHSIMNLVLFPMWLLSGSFFPVTALPAYLKPVVYANPMTYGMSALQAGLYFPQTSVAPLPFGVSIMATAGFGVALIAASAALTRVRRKEVIET